MRRMPAEETKGALPPFAYFNTSQDCLRRYMSTDADVALQCDQRQPCRNCLRRTPQPECRYQTTP